MLTTAGGVAVILIVLGELLPEAAALLDRRALDRRGDHPADQVGIVVLVTVSADADSIRLLAGVVGLLALVLALDVQCFDGRTGSASTWTRAGCS
jgi:hypothetical protein